MTDKTNKEALDEAAEAYYGSDYGRSVDHSEEPDRRAVIAREEELKLPPSPTPLGKDSAPFNSKIKEVKVDRDKEEEEIKIEVIFNSLSVFFRIKEIINELSEATVVTWTEAGDVSSYSTTYYLKVKNNGSKASMATMLSKAFDDRDAKKFLPWTIMIAMLADTIEEELSKEKTDFSLDEIVEEETTYLQDPFIEDKQLNMLFGMGSAGKTLLALHFAAKLAKDGKKIMLIDYEDSAGLVKGKIMKLANDIDKDNFIYFDTRMIPVCDQAVKIKRVIKKRKIDMIILDSASLATGKSTSDDEAALRSLAVLKSTKLPTIIIAHDRKTEGGENPIGSIQWYNQVRNAWHIKSVQDIGDDEVLHISCTQKKSNNARKQKDALGFRIKYERKTINGRSNVLVDIDVKTEDPKMNFEENLTLDDRIMGVITAEGNITAIEVFNKVNDELKSASKTGTSQKYVGNRLGVLKKKGLITNNSKSEWMLVAVNSMMHSETISQLKLKSETK